MQRMFFVQIKRADTFQLFFQTDGVSRIQNRHFIRKRFSVRFVRTDESLRVITDNYFLMTSVLNRRPQTTCIQVWHANGSLKKFGLEDVTNQNRPASDISRFKKVYRSFDFVTVGSDAMADVFKKSFGIRDGQLLKTGIPLTDVYYEEHKPELKHKWPKKIILYAPTFRDYDMQSFRLPFTEEQLTNALNGELFFQTDGVSRIQNRHFIRKRFSVRFVRTDESLRILFKRYQQGQMVLGLYRLEQNAENRQIYRIKSGE